jgi:uncharacterized repeat protein (TIGR03803 family)
MRIVSRGMAITLAALSLAGSALAAPVETVLYSFKDVPDGRGPVAGLIFDKQGVLYGTTYGGGTAGNGTVFKLTPPAKGQTAWTETVLYRFKGGSDGSGPSAGLIADNSDALYGTTQQGGGTGFGTVFKLTPPAKGQTVWTETVLYRFKGVPDGRGPVAGLIFDKQGALYSTTGGGGTGNGGTVFKLTPPAKGQTVWTETVLYSWPPFPGVPDGLTPLAGLIFDKQGVLYGTTSGGGESGNFGLGNGTVFKLTPPAKGQTAWTETVLYRFKGGSDGFYPVAGLIADSGALYGTTTQQGGGSGSGTVFKLTPPAKGQTVWTETVLYRFKGGSDGSGPFAGLIADKQGALYSTTNQGGSGPGPGFGTVFKLTPPAKGQTVWTETVLYSFKDVPDGRGAGAGLIADKQGALYSTTGGGGTAGNGTVFKLTLCDHDGCPAFLSEE